jgi:hypothetical protein
MVRVETGAVPGPAPMIAGWRSGCFGLLAALALCCGAQGASAETVDSLGGRLPVGSGMKCYSATYDKAHLASHPKQRITALSLAMVPEPPSDGPRRWNYVIVMRMKGEKGALWQADTCRADEPGAIRCLVACDGGHFTLSAPEAGSGLRLELGETYYVQGGCADDRKTVLLSAETEEPTYALDARDMKVCRSEIGASRKASEWLKELGRKR